MDFISDAVSDRRRWRHRSFRSRTNESSLNFLSSRAAKKLFFSRPPTEKSIFSLFRRLAIGQHIRLSPFSQWIFLVQASLAGKIPQQIKREKKEKSLISGSSDYKQLWANLMNVEVGKRRGIVKKWNGRTFLIEFVDNQIKATATVGFGD